MCVNRSYRVFDQRIFVFGLPIVSNFKLNVEKHHGIAAMDHVWLVKDRDQPLQDDESVHGCISAGSEVQLLVELKVNKRMLALLP